MKKYFITYIIRLVPLLVNFFFLFNIIELKTENDIGRIN